MTVGHQIRLNKDALACHKLRRSALPISCIWFDHASACEAHINQLTVTFEQNPNYKYLYLGALSELCIEATIARRQEVTKYWLPYLYQ
ncbi:hypothetical protein N482_09595 [Pseudoalteromonas luteoviolacea NCIMB 1942]|uniref:Uncharacterized protein n=1 Tax=Pseudoalteromonas luteoviolacea NCIMB 1942 TaxID=1365253 RepID=A0A162AC66_9GAMM|nr:hypothetical protein N482_09595 [Pseudoalteromonas luteoviolacea NCIMB 1942]